jgi:gas vesicle protein
MANIKPDNPKEATSRSKFISNYIDPKSPTFGNQTRSAISAYPHLKESSSRSKISRLLKNENSQLSNELRQALKDTSLEIRSRVQLLSNIIKAPTSKTVATDSDGNTISSVTKHDPTLQLKALDMINRLSGDYAKADAQVSLVHESMSQWLKKHSSRLLDNK